MSKLATKWAQCVLYFTKDSGNIFPTSWLHYKYIEKDPLSPQIDIPYHHFLLTPLPLIHAAIHLPWGQGGNPAGQNSHIIQGDFFTIFFHMTRVWENADILRYFELVTTLLYLVKF